MHLVLLPGMDGTGDLFMRFQKALPEEVAVTVAKYPRNKSLSWEGLASQVAKQIPKEEPFIIVAESFSGPIGITLAAKNQPNLLGLVLCSSFSSNPLPWGLRWLSRLSKPRIFRKRLPVSIIRRLFVGSGASPSLIEEVQAAIASVEPEVLSQRVQMVANVNSNLELGRVQAPLLYLAGERDRLIKYRGFNQIVAGLSSARLTSIHGPHLLMQRRPNECAKAILDFFGEGEAQPIFPLKVVWTEEGEEESYVNEWELLHNLEYYDSNDPGFKKESHVLDSLSRKVSLKVNLGGGECSASLECNSEQPNPLREGR